MRARLLDAAIPDVVEKLTPVLIQHDDGTMFVVYRLPPGVSGLLSGFLDDWWEMEST